ncbi:MAG: AAA family ATPase [Cypionkella sp.]
MRILSISGQNIASLADPFHIDLTAEPLRSAGLFAITGETGAGKSSILDAMCLALYGDAPRLSSGSKQDEIPDAGGEAIKAQDPRAILRKGAAQGWATVTFTGIDGLVYEARWTARRARDRVEGKLQGVSRQIARVSDGQVLASQLSAVTEKVQALTGLSYDEFRRTVLLAQGDFDAFLRAETNERAALLEKVTGTGLYRAISSRVFDRTAEAQFAFIALTLQRDAHQLLSDADRAGLEADLAALIAAVQAARPERLALEADLACHKRLAEGQARLAEADHALTLSHAARDAAEADRLHLATIDRAEPLRLPFEALRHAQTAATRATEALAQAETQRQNALAKAEALRLSAEAASVAHDATEAAYKTLGPIWTKATQLDSRLQDATAEADRAAETAREVLLAHDKAQANLAALQKQSTDTAARLDTAAAQLTNLAALAPLADHWPQIARDLTEREGARKSRLAAQDRAAGLATQANLATDQLQALDRADAVDREARQSLTEKLQGLTTRIADLEAAAPQTRLTGLASLATTLDLLERSRLDHQNALTASQNASAEAAKASADRLAAEDAIARSQTALHQAEARAQALTAPSQQANLATSESARALRLHLHTGEPCPVCGATDHPAPADTALATLAARLRADLTAAHADATAARSRLTTAQGQAAGAEAKAAQAGLTLNAEAARAASARATWAKALQTARANPFCPALPDAPDGANLATNATANTTALSAALSVLPSVAEAIRVTESAKALTLATLSDLATLRRDKDVTEGQRNLVSSALETRDAARKDLTRQQAQIAQDHALARQSAEAAQLRATELDAALLPLLTAAAEPATALDTAPAALRQRLEVKAQAFIAALAAKDDLQAALGELAAKCATGTVQASDAAAQAEKARQAETARALAGDTLHAERAALLGGEPTDTHRSRHNEARLASETAKAAAAKVLSSAEAALGLATGNHDSATRTLTDAKASALTAEVALAEALSVSDLAPEALSPLFALSRATVEALRQSLRALQDAVTAAQSTAAARRADLTAAELAGTPETPAEVLAEQILAHDAAQSARQESIGARHTRLATDRDTRAALQGLQAEIDRAQATLEVWQAVNAAIGSRNGDAFARIAQSITLDLLVDHANHHLADLKPRYRLRRAAGLALQVEDLDMGAEARATRSLSGGERFLVSLALALALSRMGDKGGLAATLFIDEGFGALDAESLDLAIDALETLQAQGRMIGVISHVEAMKDRIPVQVRVRRQGGGKSTITVSGQSAPSGYLASVTSI